MSQNPLVSLGSLMASRTGTINPAKFPEEVFDLYSISAFDSGRPELTMGSQIGSPKQIVLPGDVLLSKIVPHIRRCWIVGPFRGNRLIASGEWIIFRTSSVDATYLRHVLMGDPFHLQFMNTVAGVGGSLLRARPNFVAKIAIPSPSISEQQRIAQILDGVEALRAKRRETITLLGDLAQSIFLDMFGNDGNQSISALDKHLSFVTSGGRGWAKYYSPHGVRFIRSLDVRMNEIGNRDAVYVIAPDNAEARRTRTEEGDVLLTITGSLIGRVAPVPSSLQGSYVSQHVAILRTSKESLRPEFLSFYLSLPFGGQRQIRNMQYGQTKPGLNFEQIRSIEVPIPPMSAQNVFLRQLAAIRQLRADNFSHLAELDALFASLQYRAFHGEPWVNNPAA